MRSPTLVVLLACVLTVMVPRVSCRRILVGGSKGWTTSVNYTEWAKTQHFYLGDWLYFVYDRNQMNVLEVNKTDYETCNSDHPLVNWTRGAGRDVVPLNQTKTYYIISGKGFCFGGMKLAAKVEKPPPPPSQAPGKDNAAPRFSYKSHLVLPLAFAVGAVWDSLLQLMW
uniref:Phytocyanin domain-containing protein n=3 Tax=Opuntia streptacantha TaxID=393608 RepID=A0A7C8ZZU9_OPUST